MSSLKTGLR